MQRKIIGMGALALCLTTVLQAKVLINNENFALWIGIVVLSAVALAILYFSSQHAKKMQLMHQLESWTNKLRWKKTKTFY